MKKYTFSLIFVSILFLAFTACQKDEADQDDPEPVPEVDNSLIIAQTDVYTYVIVSPTTGAVLSAVQPNVISLERWTLGYHSNKAVFTSKEPGGSFVKVIYTCERATGNSLFQVTSEEDWDVSEFDVSPVAPTIVFAAQDVDMLSDDQIHRINEDGSAYQQLTFKDEGIECPGKIATKMVFAYEPAWSPNGAYIAFNGKLREIDSNHPHDAIIIMDANGNNKQVVYSEPLNTINISDICWTQDGKFLVFLMGLGNEMQVKVLNVNTLGMIDITNQLTVNGSQPTSLWTSPSTNQIVFNKYEPGGGDLYLINYLISDTEQFIVNGTWTMLASREASGYHYGEPNWQHWPANLE
ncbi:MAG: hypothetical protein V2I47_10595 [Bacteroidales bacterium]|jgi:Tol biopolymer transport system component|nr:hypothetical protein [Bacteroidales bacterium]